MKKILLAAFLCMFTSFAHSQVFFGPEVGVNVSNLKMKYPDVIFNNRTSGGFRGGVLVMAFADKQLSLLSGLTYYSFRANVVANQGGNYFVSHLLMHTLQLPLFLHVQPRQGAYGRFFAGIGFAADYHLSLKEFVGDRSNTLPIGNKSTDSFKPFDISLGFDAGYRVRNGITVRAQYQFGMSNLSNQAVETISSRSFAFTVAYLPNQSKTKPAGANK